MGKQKRLGYVFVVATEGGISWIGSSPQPLRAVRRLVDSWQEGPKLSLRLLIEHKNAHALAKKLRTHYDDKRCGPRPGWFELTTKDFRLLYRNATYVVESGPK